MNLRTAATLAVLALASTACGGTDEPAGTLAEPTAAVVAEATEAPAAEPEATATTAAPSTFKAGDVVNITDTGATITLESVSKLPSGEVAGVFVYDNTTGKEEQIVSSMIGFDLKDGNGNKAAPTIVFEGAPAPSGLDGTVAIGDKLRGYIAWKMDGMSGPLKIQYAPNFLDAGNTIVWDLGEVQ